MGFKEQPESEEMIFKKYILYQSLMKLYLQPLRCWRSCLERPDGNREVRWFDFKIKWGVSSVG